MRSSGGRARHGLPHTGRNWTLGSQPRRPSRRSTAWRSTKHGSDEWSVPLVKITGAGHRAARGHPHQLTAGDLTVDPEWAGKLQRFVTDLGVDTSEAKGPGWFLVSWWG